MPQGAAGPERGVETPNLMTSAAPARPGFTATSAARARSAKPIRGDGRFIAKSLLRSCAVPIGDGTIKVHVLCRQVTRSQELSGRIFATVPADCTRAAPAAIRCAAFLEVALVDDVVAVEHRPRLVGGDFHRAVLGQAVAAHVPDTGPPQVVDDEARRAGRAAGGEPRLPEAADRPPDLPAAGRRSRG